MKRHILCLLFLFICKITLAQQAAFTLFAEEQFRGVQIYDIIQDQQLNYLFATNEGLFYYDYHTYEKLECQDAKSNSVFNLVKGIHDEIYCHNLNNQLFVIKNKKINLLYELKEDESRSDIGVITDKEGNLVITAKKIIVINAKGEVIRKESISKSYGGKPILLNSGDIMLHTSNSDSVFLLNKNKLKTAKIYVDSFEKKGDWLFSFFRLKGELYAYEHKSKEHFTINEKTLEFKHCNYNAAFANGESPRVYETRNNIWVAGTLQGIHLLNQQNIHSSQNLLYSNYYISSVYEDAEGNFLLGTFDKGILLVSDLNIPDVIGTFENDPITAILPHNKDKLYLGSSSGSVFCKEGNNLKTIDNRGIRPINNIYSSKNYPYAFYDNGYIRAIDLNKGDITEIYQLSLKDVCFAKNDLSYFATNIGVFEVSSNKNKFQLKLIDSLNKRTYAIAFDSIHEKLYVSSSTGLIEYSNGSKIKHITYNGKNVFTGPIVFANNKIYGFSSKYGIIIIENGQITKVIPVIINHQKESVKKISIYKGTIIASTVKGLYQFNLNGELLQSYHNNFGFNGQQIINFTGSDNTLWVSHAGGVQAIDLNYQGFKNYKPTIRFDNLLVNDSVFSFKGNNCFENQMRKFQFSFSTPSLKHLENIRYHYRLMGYDSTWNTTDIKNSLITYNALDAGDYSFEVKAENSGLYSNVIRYHFIIEKPLYAKWWFISLIALLFLSIISIIYKYQLTLQKRKSERRNELNSSKLTAIQSQMNPHFIFNSLNSIQDLILKGDTEHSYVYIATFSNLVRKTLKYSEKDFIDFEQEVQLLEIYLSLEKLRFKKDFDFHINTNNIEDIMIPPLLLQPFVENSLVHGLLHKEGQKTVSINFKLDDSLICTISDNGIGRERAKAIKERQKGSHESFSGKAIKKRFEILSSVYAGKFGFDYEDIIENNEIAGTKVTLKIPVKHKF